jgi:hypothetical protein
MLSVFQIFKMVFGVVASIVVLYFLITYAGSYGESQKDVQRSLIMKNFRQLADDVYLSANPYDFDLSKFGASIYFDATASPPMFRFGNNEMEVDTPVFFRQGESLSVTRSALDYGWWSFAFVEAVPEMTVVFNPLDVTDDAWTVMKNITSALPDTIQTSTNVRYAFCGYPGPSDVTTPLERFEFYTLLSDFDFEGTTFYDCLAAMETNYELVTVSSACSSGYRGICVNQASGVFYIHGSADGHPYNDGLDIAAAVIGGTYDDGIHGINGEALYLYKQSALRKQMRLAAEITAGRARMMHDSLYEMVMDGRIAAGSDPYSCIAMYDQLRAAAEGVRAVLYYDNYYEDATFRANLRSALAQASAAYAGLASKGCELLDVSR